MGVTNVCRRKRSKYSAHFSATRSCRDRGRVIRWLITLVISSYSGHYLECSHGNHHALLHVLGAAEFLVLGQEVMRYGHQGVPRPALEPVHGAARYQARELFRSKVKVHFNTFCNSRIFNLAVSGLTFKARVRNFSPTGEKQRTTWRLLRTRDRKKS